MRPRREAAARVLSLEDSIQRRGRALSHVVHARLDRSVIGEDEVQTIFVKDMDRASLEEVAVLTKDIGLGAFARDGSYRQHENFLELVDRHLQANTLPRAKT